MESKAQQFERKALEAEEKAETVREPEAQQMWQDIAAHWRAMAAQARRHDW